MNINDKMRAWRDVADGGGAADLRRALRETLEQIRQAVAGETPAPEPEPEKPDLTAAHYLEVCAKLDALTDLMEETKDAKRKRVDLVALEEILN